MKISLINYSILDKGIRSVWILFLILIFRKRLNLKSFKSANVILWTFFLAYLIVPYGFRIQFDANGDSEIITRIIRLITFINDIINKVTLDIEAFLYPLNRIILSLPLCIYLIYKIYIFKKVINNSKIYEDKRILNTIKSFNLKRKVKVYINNDLNSPITFGVLRPKIVIQREIIEDTKLLDHVLIHELTHIKKYHIIFNHIVNILACIYWFNPIFWLSLKRVEQDIEINCDKEVIDKLGDSRKIRKDYCKSLLKFMEMNFYKNSFYLRMNPNKERIEVIRNYKTTINGIIGFIIILALSMPAYASVDYIDYDMVTLVKGSVADYDDVNNDKIEIINDDEYQRLELGKTSINSLRAANIDNRINIGSYEKNEYKIDMNSIVEKMHSGFTIKLSDMICRGGVKYTVIVEENGGIVYQETFYSDMIIKVKSNLRSRYSIIIINLNNKRLTGDLKINSYIR
ncbi:M56 family metallopeptidase [uncultured Anaerococcus sp.]|uniref:M56 family metallopeptidase n=2 Tax=Anaerococcus TaxID=165779 RepID=UPI00288C4017|nr:M56 family metallopeptidase [uncultured Anaerococcus sp.]